MDADVPSNTRNKLESSGSNAGTTGFFGWGDARGESQMTFLSSDKFFFASTWFDDGYLVDPASSHMLVSKIKPCMSKYKQSIL